MSGQKGERCGERDSGRRPITAITLSLARHRVGEHVRDYELLTLQRLASEIGVNIHTLRSAARTGRLKVQFQTRSVFGQPVGV
jgi:hypothetical protein